MIDFAELKNRITYAEVITRLGLQLKQMGNQWRGKCPCSDSQRGLVVTEGRGAYCWSDGKGGDVLWLVSHVRKITVKEAAEWLGGKPTVPENDGGAQPNKKLEPLSYLQSEHEAVIALGFSAEFAKKHGIGYASKGVARDHVLVPFRSETGELLGYVGLDSAPWLPKDFQ